MEKFGSLQSHRRALSADNIRNDVILGLSVGNFNGYAFGCFPFGHTAVIFVLGFIAGHSPVDFYLDLSAVLVTSGENRSRCRPGACQHRADHHEIRAEGKGLDNVSRCANTAVGNDGTVGLCTFFDGREVWYTEAGLDPRGADGTSSNAHLYNIRATGGQIVCAGIGRDIASDLIVCD
jgi:hypothetical protein